ncbi:MAG TPA: acetyl-CoA carboxylase biotin carboxylase subunit [Dehalococcoidia bacterium]|nr:acetyl-CoA carboxylase biotin carboxylase subunit [Dehalococcoidia bacterium]
MFRSVLIANRGEIAVRIIRTCRDLGIETVAVYSDADRRALHVLEADRAVYIGGSAPGESYLNIKAIVGAAKDSRAEAVHPGYGLLSENAPFAQACLDAGLVFIGPEPSVIAAMGDKAAARKIVAARGVPIVPGYDGDDQGVAELLKQAKRIGFPVMIKAAAGGGGRGMRIAESASKFEELTESARREAERAFGDGRLILERAITGARHIEVQVLADGSGNTVHLGERDCSVQRRHQKVIEESPSPFVDEAMRVRMGEAAVEAARAAGYANAGTVEFLVDADKNFYFLEMNTRLQVEHGVTEMVTGLDIVALQLQIAAGQPLSFAQDDIKFRGHAIECRVYAEDPANDYLPSAGRITVFEPPPGHGVRNDVGVYEGFEVSTFYDPMLAKLLTWGRDRPQAIARMRTALGRYRIAGVKTNLGMLQSVVSHPVFEAGETTTAFLQTEFIAGAPAAGVPDEALLAAFGAIVMGVGAVDDPWVAGGSWRLAGARLVQLRHGSTPYGVTGRRRGNEWSITINGKHHRARFAARGDTVLVETGDGTRPAEVGRPVGADGAIEVTLRGQSYRLEMARAEDKHVHPEGHREKGLAAPMPGLVLRVLVREGEPVHTHQTLVVIEAMKMEHSIEAPHDGVVKKVHCQEGGRVSEGQLLIELEQDGVS